MTAPDQYAAQLTPDTEDDADFSDIPEHDPETGDVDPDEQGGGDHA